MKIDDENIGGFPNRGEVMELKKHDMRPPSLVARLMGLDSIPSNHRDKGKKKKKKPSHQIQDNNKCGLFGEEEEEEEEDNGIDKSRPQKMQRTTAGVCDRRGVMVKKFGSEALQIKNVLTRKYNSHHQHQKLASPPVRSPRLHNRRNSRLIDAAARILEPGKRNAKHAIVYPGSSGVRRLNNVGKEPVVSPEFQHGYNSSNSVASCKACGSFVDVHGSSHVAEEEIGNNMACVAKPTPFERSKRNVFWRNQEPSISVASGKGRDFTDPMEKKAPHPARFPLVAQSHTFQSKRGCSSSPVNAINCKEKDFVAMSRASISRNHHHSKARFENSDLNVQRKSYTRVEESSNRSGLSTPGRKRRLACVSGQVQGSSSMSPLDGESTCSNGSPHRNYSQRCRETKGVPSQMGESNPRTTLDAGTVGLIQQKLKEFASQEEDEAIIGSEFPNKQASLILHELLSSIAHQQPYAETAYRVCLKVYTF